MVIAIGEMLGNTKSGKQKGGKRKGGKKIEKSRGVKRWW